MNYRLMGETVDERGIYSIHKKHMYNTEIDVVIKLPLFYEKKMCFVRLDKMEQYTVMKMLGIPTPETRKVKHQFTEFYDLLFKYNKDVVLKPSMGAKSLGVHILSQNDVETIAEGKDLDKFVSMHMSNPKNRESIEEKNRKYDIKSLCYGSSGAVVQTKLDLISEDRIYLGVVGDNIVIQNRWVDEHKYTLGKLTVRAIDTLSDSIQSILMKFRLFMLECKIPAISLDIGYTGDGPYILEFSGQFGYSVGITEEGYNELNTIVKSSIERIEEEIQKIP